MFRKLFRLVLFLFRAKSIKGHGIHSPFIYDLVTRVLQNNRDMETERLLSCRKGVETDKSRLNSSKFGAGTSKKSQNQVEARKLARHTGIPHKYGMLLYNLVNEFKPASVIELGTGLGLSTAYLALASPHSKVISIEGSTDRATYASLFFEKLGLQNIIQKTGDFDALLPGIISSAKHPLLVFVDGNHKHKPTINYFRIILDHANENTIVIFDDIYWSVEMERAWKEIIADEKVILSIDFFRLGVVFFRKGMEKQHIFLNSLKLFIV